MMTETQKQTAGIAVTSLVLGILGMLCLGPLCSIPAVICGHVAMSKIKKNRDALAGDGMALAGLILGYVQIGFMVILLPLMAAIAIPSFVKARDAAQAAICVSNMSQIEAAKQMAAMEHEHREGAVIPEAQLIEYVNAELSSLVCPREGTYTVNPVGTDPECSVHGPLSTAMEVELGIAESPDLEVSVDPGTEEVAVEE
jgi:hypothetical protein